MQQKRGGKSQSEQEKAGGVEGGREGTFSIVIGAKEVISDLKSSRCGQASEKEKEREGEKATERG